MCAIKNCPFKPSITSTLLYTIFSAFTSCTKLYALLHGYLQVCGASLKMNENPTQIGLHYVHLIYHIVNIYALRGTSCN
jgi:hypothetical protein